MLKSKPQSKQAFYKHEIFYSSPTPINFFETTLIANIQQIPERSSYLTEANKQSLNKIRVKTRAKPSSSKN